MNAEFLVIAAAAYFLVASLGSLLYHLWRTDV